VLIGDVLVSASFVSYVGPFTKPYRDEIINEKFLPFIINKKIPMSTNSNPITLLSDDATIAKWNN
jgi:dynein heavy chain